MQIRKRRREEREEREENLLVWGLPWAGFALWTGSARWRLLSLWNSGWMHKCIEGIIDLVAYISTSNNDHDSIYNENQPWLTECSQRVGWWNVKNNKLSGWSKIKKCWRFSDHAVLLSYVYFGCILPIILEFCVHLYTNQLYGIVS